jgi:hypothetical protein
VVVVQLLRLIGAELALETVENDDLPLSWAGTFTLQNKQVSGWHRLKPSLRFRSRHKNSIGGSISGHWALPAELSYSVTYCRNWFLAFGRGFEL